MTPSAAPTSTGSQPSSLRIQIGAFVVTRTTVNTAYRMVYPFLPTIARGLGIDLATAALIVTARSTLGLFSPLLGSLSDVWGRRAALLLALAMFAASMGAVAVWPTFPVVLVAMVIAAAGKSIFETGMQAYLSDRIAYERRGLALAITEMGWSGAFLVGIPLAGLLIANYGWSAPFPWLGALALIAAYGLWRLLPRDSRHTSDRPSFWAGMRVVLTHRQALVGMSAGLLIAMGNEVVNIVYGQWMEDSFGLKVAALGLASAVIGFSELSGEGLVAGLVDRLGKRRAVMFGLALNALASCALPVLGRTLPGGLVGLFLLYMTFEFSVVSAIPMMTELVPDARATMMAGNAAAFSMGRGVGALVGPLLYGYGLLANGIAAALLDIIAITLLFFLMSVN